MERRGATVTALRSALEPRLLTRQQAAERCGLTESGFSTWVVRRLVPGPYPALGAGTSRRSTKRIDRLSGLDPERELTPYEKWKQANAAREAQGH